MFDVNLQDDLRFHGYGRREITAPLDVEVGELVGALRRGGPEVVAAAIATSKEFGKRVLRAYAQRMSSLAVRSQSQQPLADAVAALVVAGLVVNDPEALLVMAPVEHAAARNNIDLPGPFAEAAPVVGAPGAVSLVSWLSRPAEARTLECMSFRLGEEADGPRCVNDL